MARKVTGNLGAFLDAIAHSEGTSTIPGSDDGYNVLCGGGLFSGYADHPRQLISLPDLAIHSTAAGRYQLLARYFDVYKERLNLPDFSPASQDAIALQQIRESRALATADAGYFDLSISRCAHIWASLPGANYGQHENQLDDLRDIYLAAGGILAKESA